MGSANSRFRVMTLTDAAAARVREIIAGSEKPIAALRVGVKNGGCAGMSYTMEFADAVSPLDEVIEDKGVKVLIDPKAVLFLLGSRMDFRTDRLSSGFFFENPNETSACGCGESVAITPASPESVPADA
ncbi:MAG TPA: iron-sulfur cluster assembly accessory protein [Roseiarcus sp.]|nr:iron-sulfur cluster assembly accessory protein [Roseiarcus sp.]